MIEDFKKNNKKGEYLLTDFNFNTIINHQSI